MARCQICKGTGTINTGNNDLPCDCPAGDTALFRAAIPGREGQPVTGREVRQHIADTRLERERLIEQLKANQRRRG